MEQVDTIESLSLEQTVELISFLEKSEEKLDQAGKSSATSAFNLGCSVGLIPLLTVVVIAYFVTHNSWVAAIAVLILMSIALVGFANLAALIARSKSMERVFETEISPGIERLCLELAISRDLFNQFSLAKMPETAYIRPFLPPPIDTESHSKRRFRFKIKR